LSPVSSGEIVGGAFGVISARVTADLGPLKLEERKERRREEREDGPRKEHCPAPRDLVHPVCGVACA
jgi:hypothetical protein